MVKVLLVEDNIEISKNIEEYFENEFEITAVYNGTDALYNLEIYSDKSSKANSIKGIMHTFNFDRLISFGDNLNDIPMFEISDECYAVKNAVQELKDLSTSVIDSNFNDGVANYLKSLNL